VVEDLLVVKLVNFCLEEQIPDEQCPQTKEIINMLLVFQQTSLAWRRWAFQQRGLLFGFWVITVNPGLVSLERKFWSFVTVSNSSWQTDTCHCYCSLMSNPGTNFAEIHYMFNSSIIINWHVPYKRPNLPVISKMVFHLSLLVIW
jgi:hypothetical protein